MRNKRVLIVVTNHQDLHNIKVAPTGLWLSELTHFYDVFEEAKIKMDIVSPKGGKIPIDSRSLAKVVLDKETKKRYEDKKFMSLLDNTKALSDIDCNSYDAIYIAGGHGAMWDLAESKELHSIIRLMFQNGKIVSAICHGVAALHNVKLSNGKYLITGRKGTCFTYFDESIAGMKKLVPYNLEKTMKDKGFIYSKAFFPLASHCVVDGNLITGQNPNSGTKTANKVLENLLKA